MRVGKLTVVIGLLSLMACSHQQAFLITAESMNAAGEQFMIVHEYMESAAKEEKIAPKTYQEWRTFGLKFQAAFPAAVHLYKVAVLADDLAMKEQAAAIILALLPELLRFAQEANVLIMELKQ